MKRCVPPLIAALFCCALPLQAQDGRVELAGFGRYTWFTYDRPLEDALGFGGGLSYFLTDRFRLQADAAYTATTDTINNLDVKHVPFHARLIYEQPLGSALRAYLGSGFLHNSYDDTRGNDSGIGSVGGLRVRLSQLSLFAHVTHDYMPDAWNTIDRNETIDTLPDGRIRITFDRLADLNWGVEAGLALRFGGKKAEPAPVAATPPPPPVQQPPAQQPPPPPPPQPQPQQPTAPVEQPRYVTLVPVYFDYDKADIRADARETLMSMIPVLNKNANAQLVIVGNTDERGSNAYNQALGARRAEAVRAFLVAQGIAASRLSTESLGETQPMEAGHGEDAWARNRRVDFRVRDNMQLLMP